MSMSAKRIGGIVTGLLGALRRRCSGGPQRDLYLGNGNEAAALQTMRRAGHFDNGVARYVLQKLLLKAPPGSRDLAAELGKGECRGARSVHGVAPLAPAALLLKSQSGWGH
jgi:hypothetical protein